MQKSKGVNYYGVNKTMKAFDIMIFQKMVNKKKKKIIKNYIQNHYFQF